MKRKLTSIITLILVLGLMHSNSFAEKGHGDFHKKMSMSDKFFMKIKMIYENQKEIGVTDDQLVQIKKIKTELKKDKIRKEAEIAILKIDIRSLMHKDKIDVAAVNKLIDQKYEIKKAKTKKVVESFSLLKKIITKDQMRQLKNLRKNKKKSYMSKDHHKGSHGDSHKGDWKK